MMHVRGASRDSREGQVHEERERKLPESGSRARMFIVLVLVFVCEECVCDVCMDGVHNVLNGTKVSPPHPGRALRSNTMTKSQLSSLFLIQAFYCTTVSYSTHNSQHSTELTHARRRSSDVVVDKINFRYTVALTC